MTLASVTRSLKQGPQRITLYGVEGVGKSTFAAGAPSPVFIGAEDGLSHLDVKQFPSPTCWQDVLDAVRELTVTEHPFKTLAIDTLDWIEPMLWDFICKRDSKKNIDDYGYGKGEKAAAAEWRVLLAALERLKNVKGMWVVLLCHSWIKAFKDPNSDGWDRYQLKLDPKAAGLVKEWSDEVFFANFEAVAYAEKGKRARGVSTGARFMYTERTAAHDAKNRHELPASMPLAWEDYHAKVVEFFAADKTAADPAELAALRAEIEKKTAGLPVEIQTKAKDLFARAGSDASMLQKLNTWVNTKLAQTGQGEE